MVSSIRLPANLPKPAVRALLCQSSHGRPAAARGRNNAETAVLQQLQEYRNNLFKVNEGRLNALSELQSARRRIAELEARVEHLGTQQAPARESSLKATPATSAPQNFASPAAPAANPASPPSPTAEAMQEPPPPPPSVTIAYGTGWENVFIHFKAGSGGWTNVPGQAMTSGNGEMRGSKVATISTSSRVEFVLNNGQGQWDTPNPYGGGQPNYIVEGPGTYFLKSGKLQRLK